MKVAEVSADDDSDDNNENDSDDALLLKDSKIPKRHLASFVPGRFRHHRRLCTVFSIVFILTTISYYSFLHGKHKQTNISANGQSSNRLKEELEVLRQRAKIIGNNGQDLVYENQNLYVEIPRPTINSFTGPKRISQTFTGPKIIEEKAQFRTTETIPTTEAPIDPVVRNAIDILNGIIDHPFTNDVEDYEKASILHYGMQERLDNLMMKLLFDEPYQSPNRQLRVAAVGGSITVGNAIPVSLVLFFFTNFTNFLL